MLVIPAIDLKDSRCVRLRQGRFEEVTVYAEDPAEVARRWEAAGARWIHVVDLDGAREGMPVNEEAVRRILQAVKCRVQLGGGIRSLEVAERWLALGVARVVLGTAALKDKGFLQKAVRCFGERVALAIDAKEGWVMVRGWTASSGRRAVEVAEEARSAGVSLIIYTDIQRDGTASGPNFSAAEEIASVGVPVVLSGGVSSLQDIERAGRIPGVMGVIVGRALYEGLIDLQEAIRRFQR